ncbi:N-acetylmuramoyl-L-alanine amidase [Luteimonas granuli]|uniref:N-acetylmuramoyl-L-alanine amidase n=1 Tax=Luteimonas granuli TaxID=1176533 RepID=A0A518N2N9_9GAMM|nr:N-acetylmuramoyl-L-alanine amidase [Luteimonas granuli]QDW66201.1 N-acetylmuramoyl-L-alanine amidase [Luteimonas granuli]
MRIHPLPYEELLDARPLRQIDLVVVHCTELPDLATARGFGERVLYPASGTGNSGHWYIDREGRVERWVDPARVAHHVRGFNARSIGVELVNSGRWPDWLDSRRQAMEEPYPDAQIEALLSLLATLSVDLPALRWIAGHEDLDTGLVPASDDPAVQVRRKLDPGPLFPWARVLAATPLQRLEKGERRESARRGSV